MTAMARQTMNAPKRMNPEMISIIMQALCVAGECNCEATGDVVLATNKKYVELCAKFCLYIEKYYGGDYLSVLSSVGGMSLAEFQAKLKEWRDEWVQE
jgi:hypothetical protein